MDILWTNNDINTFVDCKIIFTVPISIQEVNLLFGNHCSGVDVRGSDEVCNKGVLWFIVDVFWCSNLLDDAIVPDNDCIGPSQSLFLIMGNVNKGDAKLFVPVF